MEPVRRIRFALLAVCVVVLAGTVGYLVLGFSVLDAVYQTVTTITTVGFREVRPLDTTGKIFTICLIVVGVGTALYTFGILLEALVEGHLRQYAGRRRMDRDIAAMRGHVIICGWGRVGQALAKFLAPTGTPVVVVDVDSARLSGLASPHVAGDATDDAVLEAAGIDSARVLVAALAADSDNVYVTLSAKSLNPDLVVIARARSEASERILARAGADRVVNAQRIGAQRIGAFALQPHVADFLDVVMYEENLEFRLEEVIVTAGSPLVGNTLHAAGLQEATGALVLAVRAAHGPFRPNPSPETVLRGGDVLIVVGTPDQLAAVRAANAVPASA